MYLLPFLAERFPSLRFLHLVRDGRDMAFAKTQGGIRKHGTAILGKDERALRRPLRSAALWSSVNVAVASYGDEHMAERYLRIRFEDLCERPASTTADILRFFRLSGDAEALATAVDLPNSVGRWRSGERSVIDELERLAEPGLVRFGYITSRTAAG